MKTNLNITIQNSEDAKAFILELCENHEAYHPEDNSFYVIDYDTKQQSFTNEECERLNMLMCDVFKFADFDPCKVILENM